MNHDKREKAINDLLEWTMEDAVNRGVLIFACDEERVRMAYNGNRRNLVESLAVSMLNEDRIRGVCTQAITAVRSIEQETSKQING